MAVTDRKIARDAAVARKELVVPLTVAVSQTDRPFYVFKPGYGFRVERISGHTLLLAGVVSFDAVIVRDTDIIRAGATTVHSVAEQLALALSRYIVGGRVFEKAAATAITFTAAHVITALKFGVIRIQVNNAGVVSSKVPVSPQAYNTAGEALAALPAADADKVAISYLLIENNAVDWTANTDDLTAASDIQAITIVNEAAAARALSADKAFVTNEAGLGALSATPAALEGKETESLALLYTSDGSGALTHGSVTAVIRPAPLNGDVFLG